MEKNLDDEENLLEDSPILLISLGQTRMLRIRNKQDNSNYKDYPLSNRTIIVMNGYFNSELTYEIPQIKGKKSKNFRRHITLTFRTIKT